MSDQIKSYLGDSVYAELLPAGPDSQIRLTTEDGTGDDPSNEIFLEPEVFRALEQFAEKIGWRPQ